ncbi:MAG: hypothetical protein IJT66_06485 [Clostridia bacterium]|nr:hypothetical protein [Clostridia bacterium]
MKTIKILFCGLFFLIITSFGVLTVFRNEPYGDLEKRELQTFPAFKAASLTEETYFQTLTAAFSDQLPFRNQLIEAYYLFWFQHYYGDVAEGKNGQLYAAHQTVSKGYYQSLAEVTRLVNEEAQAVTEAGARFVWLSVPRKDAVMTDDLPDAYISSKEIYKKSLKTVKENLSDKVLLLDAAEVFSSAPEIVPYFSTDHHLTPRGGYLLYGQIWKALYGETLPVFDERYEVEKVIVNGAFNRQIGQKVRAAAEELTITPKTPVPNERTDNGKKSTLPLFGTGNDYEAAFMGGDQALTAVETHRSGKPRLLFVGSSFTNVLEAMAVADCDGMVSVDYRHNTSGVSVAQLVREYRIDAVIFVPSQSTNAFSVSKIRQHIGKGE